MILLRVLRFFLFPKLPSSISISTFQIIFFSFSIFQFDWKIFECLPFFEHKSILILNGKLNLPGEVFGNCKSCGLWLKFVWKLITNDFKIPLSSWILIKTIIWIHSERIVDDLKDLNHVSSVANLRNFCFTTFVSIVGVSQY